MAKSFLNQPGLPIGLRNNNPGNLRPGINWQGAIGENGGFLVFQDIGYGIRAMATDIGNDIRLDGKNTIRKLVTEYAPPTENDTSQYISRMVSYTGFGADQAFPINADTLLKLIRGHIRVELGDSYAKMITDTDIQGGIAMISQELQEYFGIDGMQLPGITDPGIVIGAIVAAAAAYFLLK